MHEVLPFIRWNYVGHNCMLKGLSMLRAPIQPSYTVLWRSEISSVSGGGGSCDHLQLNEILRQTNNGLPPSGYLILSAALLFSLLQATQWLSYLILSAALLFFRLPFSGYPDPHRQICSALSFRLPNGLATSFGLPDPLSCSALLSRLGCPMV
jgi:hypothetical protein